MLSRLASRFPASAADLNPVPCPVPPTHCPQADVVATNQRQLDLQLLQVG